MEGLTHQLGPIAAPLSSHRRALTSTKTPWSKMQGVKSGLGLDHIPNGGTIGFGYGAFRADLCI
jgi:hypothetical protein